MSMHRCYIFGFRDVDQFYDWMGWCTQEFGNRVSFARDFDRITYQTYRDIIFENEEDYTWFLLKWM